jgi:hypothetical protein
MYRNQQQHHSSIEVIYTYSLVVALEVKPYIFSSFGGGTVSATPKSLVTDTYRVPTVLESPKTTVI